MRMEVSHGQDSLVWFFSVCSPPQLCAPCCVGLKSVWVKSKPPGIGPQVLVLGFIYQGKPFCGTYFWPTAKFRLPPKFRAALGVCCQGAGRRLARPPAARCGAGSRSLPGLVPGRRLRGWRIKQQKNYRTYMLLLLLLSFL